MYKTNYTIKYYSERYKKHVTVPQGYLTDGATGAIDIQSEAWKVHDWLCGNWLGSGPKPIGGVFDDGTKCNNRQASQILSDILKSEGRWIRAQYWYTFTWLFGGGKARENGMW
jgi:hypothetical protein